MAIVQPAGIMGKNHCSRPIIQRGIIEEEDSIAAWPTYEEGLVSYRPSLELGICPPHHPHIHFTSH